MGLEAQIRDDLRTAMKNGDTVTRATLRDLLGTLTRAEELSGRPLSDGDILREISRAAEDRRKTADQFRQYARPDLAEPEDDQRRVLERYLPEPLSRSQLQRIAETAIDQLGLTRRQQIGLAMRELAPLVQGRADGAVLKEIAVDYLSRLEDSAAQDSKDG